MRASSSGKTATSDVCNWYIEISGEEGRAGQTLAPPDIRISPIVGHCLPSQPKVTTRHIAIARQQFCILGCCPYILFISESGHTLRRIHALPPVTRKGTLPPWKKQESPWGNMCDQWRRAVDGQETANRDSPCGTLVAGKRSVSWSSFGLFRKCG